MRAVAAAAVVSLALVGAYLALGGASYAPAKAADPCAPRDWRDPSGLSEVGEQIVLSALDGAACELEIPREEVVLAFESRAELERFSRKHGIVGAELEALVRSGLLRAVADAQQAGVLQGSVADLLRGVVRSIPVESFLDLLETIIPS